MKTSLCDLTGKTALVAGGCGNIGRAICRALAHEGATVIVADINASECLSFVAELQTTYKNPHSAISADLSTKEGIEKTVEILTSKSLHGIDIIVHCIGLISSVPIPGYAVEFEKQSLDSWELAIKVNLTSAFLLSQKMYPIIKKQEASVIFLSSIYGVLGPIWDLYKDSEMNNPLAYGASKGGLIELMRYLATLWAPNIRVNTISPGGIKRGQPEKFIKKYEHIVPLKRMAEADDIAGPVVFLASNASKYITGQNIMVDGGWTAC